MAKSKLREGDILLVPVTRTEYAIAKVLFVSTYLKNVMLIDVSTSAPVGATNPPPVPKSFGLRLYTGTQRVGNGWVQAGHDDTPIDADASLRVSAGLVWRRDERLRPATADEKTSLPREAILGCGLAVSKIQDALGLPRVDLTEAESPAAVAAAMPGERFWAVIEAAWSAAPKEAKERPDGKTAAVEEAMAAVDAALDKKMIPALRKALAKLPPAELAGFDRTLEQKLYELDRADVQRHTDGSDDGFLYARGFIVAMGRTYYDAVAADPSRAIPDMECESITYLPKKLYEASHGTLPPSGISRETGSNKPGWKKKG